MAYYMQIKIEGSEVKGESGDDKHKEWIELSSFSAGISQPASTSATLGGSKPEGRSVHSDIIVTKSLDASSSMLALACALGKRVDEATIEFCRATGKEHVTYLKVVIKNGFISSHSTSGGGEYPMESLAIAYTEIEWEYKQLNPDDFSEKTTIGHKYSLKTNTGE